MKNKNKVILMALSAVLFLPACARQSTPSMMNTSLPKVVPETSMRQILVAKVSDGYLANIADSYARYGSSPVHLSLAYDPASKNYTAMRAFNDLSRFKGKLLKMGLRDITAETVKSQGTDPTLMISFDSVSAQTPDGCQNMPGMSNALTTAEIGNYRFGCSTESMLAKQIYRPSDLQGNAGSDPADGRKAANIVEFDRRIEQEEVEGKLERLDRSSLSSQ